MSDITAALRQHIQDQGSISVETFMARAVAAYYADEVAFGRTGDFITAPEVSQIFGELVGLWTAVVWGEMGAPTPVRLLELGGGRGTLMHDLLRAARQQAPAFYQAIDLHLIEKSRTLRDQQVTAAAPKRASLLTAVHDLPPGPCLMIANEYFDALPIRQWVNTATGWRERMVDWSNDERAFALGPGTQPMASPGAAYDNAKVSSVAETSPARCTEMAALARHLCVNNGAGLFFDYGYLQPAVGDSLQAMRGHQSVPALHAPGAVDLTAHVDFAALAQTARAEGARVTPVQQQGQFLLSLGAAERVQVLMASTDDPRKSREIASGLHRLTDPCAMGSLFKVMAVASPPTLHLPGFEATA